MSDRYSPSFDLSPDYGNNKNLSDSAEILDKTPSSASEADSTSSSEASPNLSKSSSLFKASDESVADSNKGNVSNKSRRSARKSSHPIYRNIIPVGSHSTRSPKTTPSKEGRCVEVVDDSESDFLAGGKSDTSEHEGDGVPEQPTASGSQYILSPPTSRSEETSSTDNNSSSIDCLHLPFQPVASNSGNAEQIGENRSEDRPSTGSEPSTADNIGEEIAVAANASGSKPSNVESSDSDWETDEETTVGLQIPKAVMERFIKEILGNLNGSYRIQTHALQALYEAAEMYLVNFFEDAALLSHQAGRATVTQEDLDLAKKIRKIRD